MSFGNIEPAVQSSAAPPPLHIDFTALPNFNYEPLSDSIDTRVLVLHPGRDADDISCHLKPISMTINPNFEALSYACGDASQVRPIQCGDGRRDVTINLHTALKYLQFPDRRAEFGQTLSAPIRMTLRNKTFTFEIRYGRNIRQCVPNSSLAWRGNKAQCRCFRGCFDCSEPRFGSIHVSLPSGGMG
jgi:hypothetical protein